jgi:PAS domain S-box-containing protein
VSSPLPPPVETIDAPAARLVDGICDRYEDACKAGQHPRVEDYLSGCPEEVRPVLLCELIRLEDFYRHADYRRRFPELATNVAADGPPSTAALHDRYELPEFHAQGGMGRVSVCHDREMGRRVAVKELRPELAACPEACRRFLLEAQITGRLEHPGIVPVYELVKAAPGRPPFYTMRFVNGRTLTEATRAYHDKRRTGGAAMVDLLTLLSAFVGVCQTVAYAHSRGVVHRDLKGCNVVLGDFGEVILLDWGLAKSIGPGGDEPESGPELSDRRGHEQTLGGVVKGTPAYLSPEQAAGRPDLIGPRTDVYGLGAILYEILAGRPPFAGPTLREVLEQVVSVEPVRPAALAGDVPAELEAACLRALAKCPDDRHASAGDLAAEVQRWLAESADRSRARQERERFFNLSLDLLCTVGPDGHFRQVNPAWEATLGWTPEELMACMYLEWVHPDDRDVTLAEVIAVAGGAARPAFENRVRHKGGAYRWVSWTANLIPGEQLVYAVGRDVTNLKEVEVALRRSQERFELAVRGSGDGLWDWDRETGESYYSPRWKGMIGYDDHEIPHDIAEWESRIHPEDRDRALTALRSCAEGGGTAYEVEYRFRHKDGSYLWILDRGVAVHGTAGVARMAGSHTDITERKRMEEALRESERRHQSALAEMAAELDQYRSRVADGQPGAGGGHGIVGGTAAES